MSGFMISYLGSTLLNGSAVPQVVSAAFPLPVALSGGIGGLSVAGVQPAGVVATANPVIVGGVDGTGVVRDLLTDATGALVVSGGGGGTVNQGNPNAGAALAWPVIFTNTSLTVVQGAAGAAGWLVVNAVAANFLATVTQGPGNTANPWSVQGPTGTGTTSSGNPVRMAGIFVTAPPTITTGQVGDIQISNRGDVHVQLTNGAGTALLASTFVSNTSQAFPGLGVLAAQYVTNGTTMDFVVKPRTAFRLPSSVATNNAANIKASAGTVMGISGMIASNTAAAYLKFFDTASAPNPAALTPLYMFPLTFATTGPLNFFAVEFPTGLYFPTGIGVAIVAGAADLDNTAIAAAQILGLNVTFQ